MIQIPLNVYQAGKSEEYIRLARLKEEVSDKIRKYESDIEYFQRVIRDNTRYYPETIVVNLGNSLKKAKLIADMANNLEKSLTAFIDLKEERNELAKKINKLKES